MAGEVITREWVFRTAEGPAEMLPRPQDFRGSVPDHISLDDITRVQKEADETYEIVTFKGVQYEHLVFNPNSDPSKTIGFGPTLYSGARKNPGNMHELAIDALLYGVPIDYLTPWSNHPAGPMRDSDYARFRKDPRFTKGNGSDDDPFRPTDSTLDIVDLYAHMDWTPPSYFMGNAEACRRLLGIMTAFGTSKGADFNGMTGLVPVKGYNTINVKADMANRLNRLGGSAVSLEVNGETQRLAKKNMKHVYPWHKYYAHQFPVPALVHPAEFARFLRMNKAMKRNNNPNKPHKHAVYLDLMAMMAMNDAPVALSYGTENPLGPANEIKTLLDQFTYDFPEDLRSPNRTITLKMVENAGIDHNTHTPTGSATLRRRSFGIRPMLGLVDEDGLRANAQKKSAG